MVEEPYATRGTEDEEEPGTPVLAACRASSDRILEQAERNVDGACSADRDIDSGGGDEPTLKVRRPGPTFASPRRPSI